MFVKKVWKKGARVFVRLRNKRLATRWVREVRPAEVVCSSDDVMLVSPVLNGMLFLVSFLRHYRALGVRHFVLCVDGRSVDGTLEALLGESDVTVLVSEAPDGCWPDSHGMTEYMLRRYAVGRWVFCVDVDELFDYPRSECCSLGGLISYLESEGYSGMYALMLDRFNREALQECETKPLEALSEQYPLYDTADLRWSSYSRRHYGNVEKPHRLMRIAHGGVMYRCFGALPLLMKHPLIKFSPEVLMRCHYFTRLQVADVTGVLNHYRFVSDLPRRAAHFLSRKRRSDLARYGTLYQRLQGEEGVRIDGPCSRVWRSVDALVEEGVLLETEAYRRWVKGWGDGGRS